MKALIVLLACILMTGCTGLLIRDDDNAGVIAGKVAVRIPLVFLTIGVSEIKLTEIKNQQEQHAYWEAYWERYARLSPEGRAWADARRAEQERAADRQAMVTAAFLAGGGFRPYQLPQYSAPMPQARTPIVPTYNPYWTPYKPTINCRSYRVGETTETHCY